jgi:hypothetical protein
MTMSKIVNSINYILSSKKFNDFELKDRHQEEGVICSLWSFENLTLNGGTSDVDELMDALNGTGIIARSTGARIDFDSPSMDAISRIEGGSSMEPIRIDSQISVEDSFRLLLHIIVKSRSEASRTPVGTDDAIFSIKNEAQIPDDFMPKYMMELVEPSYIPDFVSICNKLQISKECRNLFLIGCSKNGNIVSVPYLIPSQQCPIESDFDQESLLEILKRNFQALEHSEEYIPFIISRSLKAIIYNIRSKNNRKLPRQMSSDYVVSLLRPLDILQSSGKDWAVRDDISLEHIHLLKTKYDQLSSLTASKWLKSRLIR